MTKAPDEEELFLAAIDIVDPVERSRYIQEACQGNTQLKKSVRELLSFHEDNPTFLEENTVVPLGFKPGDSVGAFQIVDVLGEGGFGIVYRAKQERPIARHVALKVLKAGMDSAAVVQRFEQERQTLALLKHPQIAGVIDAGTTAAGRPFFVMELVEGTQVDEFCDSQRLTIRQRLDIMLQVCAAVQHAHQKGIIHRDLKPTNILVSGCIEHDDSYSRPAGERLSDSVVTHAAALVKVIDFGIAKAISTPSKGFTQHGQLLGTPDYMSPEQRQQAVDVDVRSDVYALGALLCKLLTGRPPSFHADKHATPLQQDSLQLPSSQVRQFDENRLQKVALNRRETSKTLPKHITGELDWICRKALSITRDERYASVAMFAADIKAFLKNQPVAAGPPTWRYRAKKFFRRNRLASTMMALVLLSVIAGTMLSAVGFLQANRERLRAENERTIAIAERDKSQATSELMRKLLSLGDIQAGHRADYTVRQMLDEFSKMLESKTDNGLSSQPTVEGSLRQTLGKSYWSLGLMDIAGPHLRRALKLRTSVLGKDHIQTAESEVDFAKYLTSTSQLANAEITIQRAMPILLASPPSEQLAWAYRVQAIIERERGTFDLALEHNRKAADVARKSLGVNHPTSVYLQIETAPILLELHRFKEADVISKDALEHATRLDERSYNSAVASRNRAIVLETQGDLLAAMLQIKNALRIDRSVVGETSHSTVLDLIAYARIARKRGRRKQAEEAARKACEYAEDVTIEPLIVKPQAYDELALIVREDNPELAIELWDKAIELKKQSPTVHPIAGRYLDGQATIYRRLGEMEQAEANYRECIALLQLATEDDLRRQRLRTRKRTNAHSVETDSFITSTIFKLATLLYEQGRIDDLKALMPLVSRARASGFRPSEFAADLTEVAIHLLDGNAQDAEVLLDKVIADDPGTERRLLYGWARVFKADMLLRMHDYEAASALLMHLDSFTKRRRHLSVMRMAVQRLLETLKEAGR